MKTKSKTIQIKTQRVKSIDNCKFLTAEKRLYVDNSMIYKKLSMIKYIKRW